MMYSREDVPFDDVTSVENMSQRFSPELALLEAQLVLETEYLAVAKARARCAATVVALTNATSSTNSSVRSSGSRHKRSRTLPHWATIMNLSKKTMFVIPSRMTCLP